MSYKIGFIAAMIGLTWAGVNVAGTTADGNKDAGVVIKRESFDRDPGWDGHSNRMTSDRVAVQDFGYSQTNFAARNGGEIGGSVQRSTVPAYYAEKISTATLDQKLSASGTFAVRRHKGSAGVFFGWFNSNQPGGGGRPTGSLGLDISFKSSGGALFLRLITDQNQACGLPIAPEIKTRPRGSDALQSDGTRYTWKMDYDPHETDDKGEIHFTLTRASLGKKDSQSQVFTLDVPPNLKKEGAALDRFGLLNMMKTGGAMDIYFGDLTRDGKAESLSNDPKWIGAGNRGSFPEQDQVGIQNFGFSKTNFAGGKLGEIGGAFWRAEGARSYYAERVGTLALANHLTAGGKVSLRVGAPDSAMYIGWFNSADLASASSMPKNFLGVIVEGPTRIGHYFSPTYATAAGTRGRSNGGPVIVPGKTYDWTFQYDPAAANGAGAIRVTLGENSITLPLKPGCQAEGASFDHFGLISANPGGQMVKIFFDDLRYTTAVSANASR